jgi:hypothetical protein
MAASRSKAEEVKKRWRSMASLLLMKYKDIVQSEEEKAALLFEVRIDCRWRKLVCRIVKQKLKIRYILVLLPAALQLKAAGIMSIILDFLDDSFLPKLKLETFRFC